MIEYQLQEALYSKLTGDTQLMAKVSGVFGFVEQDYNNFPYVTIGDDSTVANDTDDCLGYSSTVSIHVWSRFDGQDEVKEIQGLIYAALHRQSLSFDDYYLVECVFSDSPAIIRDPDGVTWHGVSTFSITTARD